MKTAWVFSGGGAKGDRQVGTIKALYERGLRPDCVYGTSVGSLSASGLAFTGVDGLERVWRAIRSPDDILGKQWLTLPFKRGVYNLKPLRKILEQQISGTPRLKATVCVTDFKDGRVFYKDSHSSTRAQFIDAVQASCAMPFIMEPVRETWLDGGIREQSPLKKAIDDGADKIIAVLCSPLKELHGNEHWKSKFPHITSYATRAIDLMSHEVFVNDLKLCAARNADGRYRKVEIEVYDNYPTHGSLDFYPDKIAEGIAAGYKRGFEAPIIL